MPVWDHLSDKSSDAPIVGAKGTNTNKASSDYDNDAESIYGIAEGDLNRDGGAVDTKLENWYKQLPYGFKFGKQIFYLPISPSNLNITTHFATNMITTMYGTVEEHSEQRYYDIVISGTTGMSPRYYKNVSDQRSNTQKVIGRASNPVKSRISGVAGGFMKRTQALIENTVNQASDLLSEPTATTGVDLQRTGYAAFHNFYKFLLLHKKAAIGQAKIETQDNSNLIFLNYKDNNQYNVVIQTFQLTRDAGNPMLYNYSINMRAYNLTTVDSKGIDKGITSRLKDLGLDGVSTSFATKLANKARKAKNAAYSAIAAAKGFGG